MKNYKHTPDENDNPFALSIGDLMASLLLIFILLLASTLIALKDEYEKKSDVAERYKQIKQQIYESLNDEFKEDLKNWNADIHLKSLTIRFQEPEVLFGTNQFELTSRFKEILNNFFPRYIKILSKKEFKNNIEEIRIEGHTDSIGNYYHNMELSQNRTRSVLKYVLEETELTLADKEWIQTNLTANGLSYSKPIYRNDSEMGRFYNRRVEFRIRTNAENQIDSMLKIGR